MNWIILDKEEQITEIAEKSFQKAQLIYKHSISCPTSSMAKLRLEKSVIPENIDFYYIDVIRQRPVSNKVAADFEVKHESPQILLIKDGKCIYHNSHHRINMESIIAEDV